MNAPKINIHAVLAITWKDILEAIKNRNTIGVLVSALFLAVMYRALPVLSSWGEPPSVLVYADGDSILVPLLENSSALNLYTYPSEARLKRLLAEGEVPELGLIIPASFDRDLEAGLQPQLEGYVMNWVSDKQASALVQTVASEIVRVLGEPVSIQLNPEPVYRQPDSGGIGVLASISLVFVLVMLGLMLVSHLILEEKQTKTLDMLMASPAGAFDITLAKALTGLFYCMLAAVIVLGIFHSVIIHWGLAVLAVVCGSLFTVSLGLFVGAQIESRAQLSLWSWALILPLFIPTFLVLMEDLLPAALIQVMGVIPTVVLSRVLLAAMAISVPAGFTALQLAWLLVLTATVLLVTARRLSRTDRQAPTRLRVGRLARVSQNTASRIGALLPAREIAETDVPPAGRQTGNTGWQVVWAIAVKDIRDAIQNKLFISVMLGAMIMTFSNAAMPWLVRRQNRPAAVVLDQGRSTIVRGLVGRDDFRIVLADTEEEMREAVSENIDVVLGLVIPEDFDRRAGSSETIQLQGYYPYWAGEERISERTAFFEQQLGLASWTTVQIETEGNPLYPGSETRGQTSLLALTLSLTILAIGGALVPLLLIEEKESHTLDALLVSPANFRHIIAGKAITGLFYCGLAALVAVGLNAHLIVHSGVVFLAILSSILFAVIFGLLLGVITDQAATVGLWAGLILMVLVALTLLPVLTDIEWPPLMDAILTWQPGAVLVGLYRLSMSGQAPPARIGLQIGVILFECAILGLGVAWATGRYTRRAG